MPHTVAVKNWRLLEIEITRVLRGEGVLIEKNSAGDPCAGEVNIATLAQALSARVLVKVTPISARI
ncbi:MAG: hypothetical protein WA322_04525 [Pseudolabrys sp.]